MKPGHFKKKKGSTYYSSVQVGFGLSRFVDNFPILFTAKNNVSELLLHTNGKLRESKPGNSRRDIRDSGFFKKDGEYWIDPEKNGKPIKVYCDMTTDGGKKYFGK